MKPLEDMGKFATVVIDPPWDMPMSGFSQRRVNSASGQLATELPYAALSITDLSSVPVDAVLDDDARLFCWTVNRLLPVAFDLLVGWGVQYSYTMVWHKSGGIQTPVSPCFNAEYILVGKRGTPSYLNTKAFSVANYWPRGAHSEKPEGFYDLLRRVTPGPRLDIFGRRRIAGFQSWGNEAPEGEPGPDHYQGVLLE